MLADLEVTYRARGGRMAVDLDLHLGSDGQTDVYVGTSYSIPLARVSRVGTFGGRAPTAEVNALGAYLREHDLQARGGSYGQLTPDTPARFLEITADGRTAQLHLTGMTTDAAIDGFEQLLQGLALVLTRQPIRAAAASLDVREVGGQIVAAIELGSIGTEPMTVLLVDPAQPGVTLFAGFGLEGKLALPSGGSMPMPLGNSALGPDAVQALAHDGTLPSGISDLPPGSVYRFALPPLAAPRTPLPVFAIGALEFWLPDGQARRVLILRTSETPLP